MSDVVLLDFTQAPPGYAWDERTTGYLRDIYDDLVGLLTDAWRHYKARFDPPGIQLEGEPERSGVVYRFGIETREPRSEARAAAWRWYEARLELYNILRKINPPREFWPVILTWSDAEWIEVHGFLVENAAVLTFPEVLRG